MSFTEASTVENLVRDLLCGGVTHYTAVGAGLACKSGKLAGLGWHYLVPRNIPRQPQVFVEDWIRDALIRLNPEIAADPDRADEVLYKLRAIAWCPHRRPVKANEEFTAWLRGDRSMPFGENDEHVTFASSTSRTSRTTSTSSRASSRSARGPPTRADLVLLVNGLPSS